MAKILHYVLPATLKSLKIGGKLMMNLANKQFSAKL